jgi:hypothetical protein
MLEGLLDHHAVPSFSPRSLLSFSLHLASDGPEIPYIRKRLAGLASGGSSLK